MPKWTTFAFGAPCDAKSYLSSVKNQVSDLHPLLFSPSTSQIIDGESHEQGKQDQVDTQPQDPQAAESQADFISAGSHRPQRNGHHAYGSHIPEDVEANINEERPVRWTGRKMPTAQVVRRFAFRRTVQIRHTDGLTYDYLSQMAKVLAEENVMVMMGAGDGGRGPLVFQQNGSPFRAFLEGRVDGEKYMLLLHLSNMELKRPKEAT